MKNELDELEVWFADRPVWMQDAARRIVKDGQLSNDDINQLVVLCKAQLGIYNSRVPVPKINWTAGDRICCTESRL
jgi:hypothetical protein